MPAEHTQTDALTGEDPVAQNNNNHHHRVGGSGRVGAPEGVEEFGVGREKF